MKAPQFQWLIKYPRKFKKKIAIAIYSIIFLFILIIIQQVFNIRNIEISGTKRIYGVEIYKGDMIFLIQEKEIETELTKLNPHLKDFHVKKNYPNKLIIEVKEENPMVVLEARGGFFYLSLNGRILEKTRKKEKNLPQIHYYQKFNYETYGIGDKIENIDISYALSFIDKFSALGLKTEDVDITGGDMLILESVGKTYLLTTQRSVQSQYEDLKTIVGRFKIEGVSYKTVDLRFDKPIIKL